MRYQRNKSIFVLTIQPGRSIEGVGATSDHLGIQETQSNMLEYFSSCTLVDLYTQECLGQWNWT